MRFQLLPLLIGLFLMTCLAGCDHETDTYDGPFLVDRFGEFKVLEDLALSRSIVDFSKGESVVFTARFNKRVDWEIIITGTRSGAVKRITGFDNTLTAGNAAWVGGATELPLFGKEPCTVELLVAEAGLSQTDAVEITGTKVYEGAVFTDFETAPGDKIFYGNFEFELTNNSGRRNNMPAGQGEYYYLLQGKDNVVPNFFVGLIDIKASITGQTYAPLPTTVPEDLYFNAFIRHNGEPHAIAVLQFIYDSNNTGLFEDGQDQVFPLGDIPLNWTGWRHTSKKMSEVGMTQQQLEKLVAIRVLLISDKNSQPNPPLQVEFGIDFLTFTAGKPLEL